jgi:hypothetical protein
VKQTLNPQMQMVFLVVLILAYSSSLSGLGYGSHFNPFTCHFPLIFCEKYKNMAFVSGDFGGFDF